jgi:hypothetical protein
VNSNFSWLTATVSQLSVLLAVAVTHFSVNGHPYVGQCGLLKSGASLSNGLLNALVSFIVRKENRAASAVQVHSKKNQYRIKQDDTSPHENQRWLQLNWKRVEWWVDRGDNSRANDQR